MWLNSDKVQNCWKIWIKLDPNSDEPQTKTATIRIKTQQSPSGKSTFLPPLFFPRKISTLYCFSVILALGAIRGGGWQFPIWRCYVQQATSPICTVALSNGELPLASCMCVQPAIFFSSWIIVNWLLLLPATPCPVAFYCRISIYNIYICNDCWGENRKYRCSRIFFCHYCSICFWKCWWRSSNEWGVKFVAF